MAIRKKKTWLKIIGIVSAIILWAICFSGMTFWLLYLRMGNSFLLVFDNPSRDEIYTLTTNIVASFSTSSLILVIILRIIKWFKHFSKKIA